VALTCAPSADSPTREIAAPSTSGGDDGATNQQGQERPAGRRLDQPGDLAVVSECSTSSTRPATGPGGRGRRGIRLARKLTLATEEPEARGLLALMLLQPRPSPGALRPRRPIVTLDRQDRGLWDARQIAEGVRVLQSALAFAPGPLQLEAASPPCTTTRERGGDRRPQISPVRRPRRLSPTTGAP